MPALLLPMTVSGNLSPFQLHPVHSNVESPNIGLKTIVLTIDSKSYLSSDFLNSSTAVSRAESTSHWRKVMNRKVSLL